MAKSRSKKQDELAAVKQTLTSSQGIVFTADTGLTVAESGSLRSIMRKENARMQSVKKTILTKALAEAKMDPIEISATGNIALAYSAEDPIAPARLVYKVAKDNERFSIVGGLLDGVFISSEKVIELAKLPGRQELLARLVGTINAPVSGFVNVLAGNLRGLVTALGAIRDKKV